MIDTPKRVVDAYGEWFEGYDADPAKELSRTFEDVQGYDDIVMLRDIEVESHCERRPGADDPPAGPGSGHPGSAGRRRCTSP